MSIHFEHVQFRNRPSRFPTQLHLRTRNLQNILEKRDFASPLRIRIQKTETMRGDNCLWPSVAAKNAILSKMKLIKMIDQRKGKNKPESKFLRVSETIFLPSTDNCVPLRLRLVFFLFDSRFFMNETFCSHRGYLKQWIRDKKREVPRIQDALEMTFLIPIERCKWINVSLNSLMPWHSRAAWIMHAYNCILFFFAFAEFHDDFLSFGLD